MNIERAIPRSAEWLWEHLMFGYSYLFDIWNEDPIRSFFVVASAVLLALALYQMWALDRMVRKLRNGKRFGRGDMSSKLLERELVADAVCSALEDLYYANKLTLKARNRWYARIGKAHALRDLFPKKKKYPKSYCVYLKDKIARRLGVSKVSDLKKVKPLPIPGPPGAPNGVYAAPIKVKGVIFGKRRAA